MSRWLLWLKKLSALLCSVDQRLLCEIVVGWKWLIVFWANLVVKREIIMPVSSAGVVSRSMKKPSQQKERHFMSLAKESTAKRILERHGIETLSSFLKI